MRSRGHRLSACLALGGAALLIGACVAPMRSARAAAPRSLELPRQLQVGTASGVVTVPLDDYILASILAEVVPTGESPEAVSTIYEVQAVTARSYAIANLGRHRADGFDVCDDTHCQRFDPARVRTSRFAEAARLAVERTRDVVLIFGSHVAEGLFHADCGGATAAAEAVWGRPVLYLPGVEDDVPGDAHRRWQFAVPPDDLRTALNQDARTRVGARLEAVAILSRDASGRAVAIGVAGERSYSVSSDVFRTVVNRALRSGSLMSTRFEVSTRGGQFRFEGTGYGHGVGLCQRGAAARARRGDTTETILRVYFPGTRLASTAARPAPRPQPWPGGRPPG